MVPLETLLAFTLTSIALELTPGPNMAYLALISAQRGRLAGFQAVAGVALGLALMGALAGVGVGSLILSNRVLFEILRWGGVTYLLWLAYDGWREAQKPAEAEPLDLSGFKFVWRGLITNLLNPKAALFYVAVLPGFTNPDAAILPQTVTLTAIYVAVATLIHASIVLLGGLAQPLLDRPGLRRQAGLAFAVLLTAIAVWLAFKTAA